MWTKGKLSDFKRFANTNLKSNLQKSFGQKMNVSPVLISEKDYIFKTEKNHMFVVVVAYK